MNVRGSLIFAVLLLFCAGAHATQWSPLGPEGGDVRSLAYDPQNPDRVFLGTSTGTIFRSTDGGRTWDYLTHLGGGDDFVVDHIIIDPRNSENIYVAAWDLENHHMGELFRSLDGGGRWKTTPGMHGKSIRALAIAPSDSQILVAGALDGVFRSRDGGRYWQRISPIHSEIRNVESIAIDSENPNIIYAGTWHLPWKTVDGGASWHHIDQGMIDDSDVFSILIDRSNSQVVFASACSGIYRSESQGDQFERVLGIPFSARRTRVLRQDPNDPAVIYAGTTEGLWITKDSGKTWKRVTSPDLVVNDVLVDPRTLHRILLATDRAGVLASASTDLKFVASNSGFSHRYVTSILASQDNPNTLFVGLANDRERGGVFVSHDAGKHWSQTSAGLDGRDVFVLRQDDHGVIVTGTNQGILALDQKASGWNLLGTASGKAPAGPRALRGLAQSLLTMKVNDLALTPESWIAATSEGLYFSLDRGSSWSRNLTLGRGYFGSVQVRDDLIVATTRRSLLISTDGGKRWSLSRSLPSYVESIQNLAITPDRELIVATSRGAFGSHNLGHTWERLQHGLPSDVSCVIYDTAGERLLASSAASTVIFESIDHGRTWHRGPDAGYTLRRVSIAGGRVVAVTRFNGVLVQSGKADDRSLTALH